MSKVVISTNYKDMIALNPALEYLQGFNLFRAHMEENSDGEEVLVQPIVCWCSDNNGYFKIYNSPDPELIQNTDLILIPDTLKVFPQEIKEAITNNDYFLAHKSTFSIQGSIAQCFDPNHVAEGHHSLDGADNCSYHRSVAQILTDSQIAPDQKAAAIIARIWPKKAVFRAARLYWLQVYYDRIPKAEEACPDVFDIVGPDMKKYFEELKKCKRGTKGWETAYKYLSNESYKYLQQL